jgi:hypothetical protein
MHRANHFTSSKFISDCQLTQGRSSNHFPKRMLLTLKGGEGIRREAKLPWKTFGQRLLHPIGLGCMQLPARPFRRRQSLAPNLSLTSTCSEAKGSNNKRDHMG